jgi:hypothetical protein
MVAVRSYRYQFLSFNGEINTVISFGTVLCMAQIDIFEK